MIAAAMYAAGLIATASAGAAALVTAWDHTHHHIHHGRHRRSK